MKVNSVNNQNFKGSLSEGVMRGITKHPALIATLAGSSVIAQKVVMSGSEAVIGPVMDIGIGKAITKATKEEDGRTNESSKVQAARTFSQAVGGTIIGIIIRAICIAASTAICMKAGEKVGEKAGKFAKIINEKSQGKFIDPKNLYELTDNASKWGKNIGGAAAIVVMMATNFLIDVPFINAINKKVTKIVNNKNNSEKQPQNEKAKEAK